MLGTGTKKFNTFQPVSAHAFGEALLQCFACDGVIHNQPQRTAFLIIIVVQPDAHVRERDIVGQRVVAMWRENQFLL